MDSRWGHVSLPFLRHSVQMGFWNFKGQKMFFFLWLPMYWAYMNFRVWVIWASVILLCFHKWFEIFWLIWSLDNHFSMYGYLFWATRTHHYTMGLRIL